MNDQGPRRSISPRVLSTKNNTHGHIRKLLRIKEVEQMLKAAILKRYVFMEKPWEWHVPEHSVEMSTNAVDCKWNSCQRSSWSENRHQNKSQVMTSETSKAYRFLLPIFCGKINSKTRIFIEELNLFSWISYMKERKWWVLS